MECRERWEKRERLALERKGFRVLRLLGEGAFSRVYCVERNATYACKVSENVGLLEREALVLSELRHTLFPAYGRLWQEEGCGFLLMEYVPGSSMEEMLKRRGGFCARQVAAAGTELASGLSYLHERQENWLFRDVKPANIIIRQNGRLSLLDFGCVCSVRESALSQAGSPGFAAPEQLKGGQLLTKACDVYGLGQTLKVMHRTRGGGRGRDASDKFAPALSQLLDLCTKKEVSRRLPDMGSVMERLWQLCRQMGYYPEKSGGLCREVLCRKDVWL